MKSLILNTINFTNYLLKINQLEFSAITQPLTKNITVQVNIPIHFSFNHSVTATSSTHAYNILQDYIENLIHRNNDLNNNEFESWVIEPQDNFDNIYHFLVCLLGFKRSNIKGLHEDDAIELVKNEILSSPFYINLSASYMKNAFTGIANDDMIRQHTNTTYHSYTAF